MQTLTTTLGLTIRQRRVAAGLSQEKLAELADVHRNHIGMLERGLRSPTVDVMDRIASALNAPCWLLLKEAEEGERLTHERGEVQT